MNLLLEELNRLTIEASHLKDKYTDNILKSVENALSNDGFARDFLEVYDGTYVELFKFSCSNSIDPLLEKGNARFMLKVCSIFNGGRQLTGKDLVEFMRPGLYHNNSSKVISAGILKDWTILLTHKGRYVHLYLFIL